VGWGESHHGRCPGAIAKLIDTTISELALGMDACNTVDVWSKIYRMQLASHGMGYASVMALSGLDLALWDIRGKSLGLPLYRLLGGGSCSIPAYAVGISLGWQDLQTNLRTKLACTFKAVIGHLNCESAIPHCVIFIGSAPFRKRLVRTSKLWSMANTGYCLEDVCRVMPAFDDYGVFWLEEPFPAHDYRDYKIASTLGRVPLAAGENHFTRFEYTRLVGDGAVRFAQPDLSKTGGITEACRIAALCSAWKITLNPHTSATGINMAASIHMLAAADNAGYFEGDVAAYNPFRDNFGGIPYALDQNGCVRPLEEPGIGIVVDEDFLAAHPLIDGPCYV